MNINLWIKPKLYFNYKKNSSIRIILNNLVFFLPALFIICLTTLEFIEESTISQSIFTAFFIILLCTPLYLILNFILTIFIGFLILITKQKFYISKLFSVVLSSNSFIFLFNAIALLIIFSFSYSITYYICMLFLIIINILGVRILYYGFRDFVKLNKLFCVSISLLSFFFTIINVIIGMINYGN